MSVTSKLFVAVKACIVNSENKILLLREASLYQDGTNVGKYDVVGGRIDTSESLEEALRREVLEESGLIVKEFSLVDVHDTFNQKGEEMWHIVRLFYKVRCEEKVVILSQDHDKYEWVDLHAIEDFEGIIDNLIPVIKKLGYI